MYHIQLLSLIGSAVYVPSRCAKDGGMEGRNETQRGSSRSRHVSLLLVTRLAVLYTRRRLRGLLAPQPCHSISDNRQLALDSQVVSDVLYIAIDAYKYTNALPLTAQVRKSRSSPLHLPPSARTCSVSLSSPSHPRQPDLRTTSQLAAVSVYICVGR